MTRELNFGLCAYNLSLAGLIALSTRQDTVLLVSATCWSPQLHCILSVAYVLDGCPQEFQHFSVMQSIIRLSVYPRALSVSWLYEIYPLGNVLSVVRFWSEISCE